MGIVDLADRTAWCQGLGHLLERLANGGEEMSLVAGDLAHGQSAHHGRVIVPAGAGPLQGQLVDGVHAACRRPREQEGAGRSLRSPHSQENPPALEDGPLQGRQDIPLEDAGACTSTALSRPRSASRAAPRTYSISAGDLITRNLLTRSEASTSSQHAARPPRASGCSP